jgi:hypothetical protein
MVACVARPRVRVRGREQRARRTVHRRSPAPGDDGPPHPCGREARYRRCA